VQVVWLPKWQSPRGGKINISMERNLIFRAKSFKLFEPDKMEI
jgi:hypothetical protein